MPLRKFSTAKITNKRVSVPITGVASGPSADRIPNFVTAAGLLGAFYDIQRTGIVKNVLAAANSAEAVTYSVDSGSLPTGLSLNTSNGAITGTASAVGVDTNSSFVIRATNQLSTQSSTRGFFIHVRAPIQNAFSYTGAAQTFTAPTDLTAFTVYAWGAGGGYGVGNPSPGGAGGYATGTVTTNPGTAYTVVVGGGGSARGGGSGAGPTRYGFAGYAGNSGYGGGGGGLSGIFTGTTPLGSTDQPRSVIVAGGGGGGAWDQNSAGGAGGGLAGANGSQGNGGTQTAAGTGGNNGSGFQGASANGGDEGGGGGGGGGYYGGGAGNGSSGYSGGGGSGFVNSPAVSSGTTVQGNSNGAPPNFSSTYFAEPCGRGGNSPGSPSGDGGNGRLVVVY